MAKKWKTPGSGKAPGSKPEIHVDAWHRHFPTFARPRFGFCARLSAAMPCGNRLAVEVFVADAEVMAAKDAGALYELVAWHFEAARKLLQAKVNEHLADI